MNDERPLRSSIIRLILQDSARILSKPCAKSWGRSRITLDDFVETITRSVMRALEAQGEVSGYALQSPAGGGVPGSPSAQPQVGFRPGGPIIIGIICTPQGGTLHQLQ